MPNGMPYAIQRNFLIINSNVPSLHCGKKPLPTNNDQIEAYMPTLHRLGVVRMAKLLWDKKWASGDRSGVWWRCNGPWSNLLTHCIFFWRAKFMWLIESVQIFFDRCKSKPNPVAFNVLGIGALWNHSYWNWSSHVKTTQSRSRNPGVQIALMKFCWGTKRLSLVMKATK